MPPTHSPDPSVVISTVSGRVRGTVTNGLRHWRGMPYARASRFMPPEPALPWAETRDAVEFGPVAPQSAKRARAPMDEQCHSINVIAPAHTVEAAPVMVFIHGGAYTAGSSREFPHLGEALVTQGDVIFVNFNYRLGALGYLDFTAYADEFTSNLGLRDQVAALEWVRDNIGAFGGDPDNVTVFGESAGANAVTTLLTVPAAEGLFARAIAESSPVDAVYPRALTRQWGAEFVAILRHLVGDASTPEVELLRGAATADLVEAGLLLRQKTPDAQPGTLAFCPSIDGDYLPERPIDAAVAGRSHAVPLIIGTNANEGTLFRGSLDLLATTKSRIRALLSHTPRPDRSRLFAEYRSLPLRGSGMQFGADYSFWYPSIAFAEAHSAHAPVRFYRFDLTTRAFRLLGLGATHGIELIALFDLRGTTIGKLAVALGGGATFGRVGELMRERWLAFAHDGSAGEDWGGYSPTGRVTLVIDEDESIVVDPHESRRVAWQGFVPRP